MIVLLYIWDGLTKEFMMGIMYWLTIKWHFLKYVLLSKYNKLLFIERSIKDTWVNYQEVELKMTHMRELNKPNRGMPIGYSL